MHRREQEYDIYVFKYLASMDSIIKFSSEDCGTCHRMSHYDATVSKELNLELIDVPMQDTATYRKYRKILLTQYPNKEGRGWPTYLIVRDLNDDFRIRGEVKGGMSKGDFRNKLKELIENQ